MEYNGVYALTNLRKDEVTKLLRPDFHLTSSSFTLKNTTPQSSCSHIHVILSMLVSVKQLRLHVGIYDLRANPPPRRRRQA